MASGNTLDDIGDRFCQCPVCLDLFKEPKQLPCLHRLCAECLQSLIQFTNGIIKCPLCNTEFNIPEEGVDGFITDFFMRSLVEYVQSQQSNESNEIRTCFDCSKSSKVAGYCLKCNGFLCFDCYSIHTTRDLSREHLQYTLSVEDIKSKNAKIIKRAPLQDAPMCSIHSETISNLCCKQCNNLPVCTACLYGYHREHDVCEIKTFAKSERNRLTMKIGSLRKVMQSKFSVSPSEVVDRLLLNANSAKEISQQEYEDNAQMVNLKMESITKTKEAMKSEKEKDKQEALSSLNIEMEQEIEKLRKKYEKLKNEKEKEINNNYQDNENAIEEDLTQLHKELWKFDKAKQNRDESIEIQVNERLTILSEISKRFESVRGYLENVESNAADVISSDKDWMAIQCVSDFCDQCDKLKEDLEGFPVYIPMSNIEIDRKKIIPETDVTIKISEEQSTIVIEFMKGLWIIRDTSSNEDGNIVIAGHHVQKAESIILVADRNGRPIQHHVLKNRAMRERFCCCLAGNKVASVCQPDEIGIYDVRENEYLKKSMHEISDWPSNRSVSCVSASGITNSIFVGSRSSGAVYIFDSTLKHQKTITLPDMLKGSRSLTVYGTKCIVCDSEGKKAVVMDIEDAEIRNVCELRKPDVNKENLKPRSACTDSNDFIYVLWTSEKFWGRDYLILAQYSKNKQHLIEARHMPTGVTCLSVLKTDRGEKLVVAAWDTFHIYDLLESPPCARIERTTSHRN